MRTTMPNSMLEALRRELRRREESPERVAGVVPTSSAGGWLSPKLTMSEAIEQSHR